MWQVFHRILTMFNIIQIAVQKKPAPKKGATKRKSTAAKKPTKWWMWLVIPAVLIAFLYALSQLSQMPSNSAGTQTPVEASKKVPAKAPVVTKKPNIPDKKAVDQAKKKEGFEFYQILQDSEVDTSHVDAYKSTPRAEQDFYYMIQAASFRNATDADRMRANLILSGLDANINKTTGKNGKPWHRVVVGPFTSRSKMNRSIDTLANKDIQAFSYRVKKEQ